MERCMSCGSDDLVQYSDGFRCNRCGALNNENGCEYSPDEVEDNIQRYDDYFEKGL